MMNHLTLVVFMASLSYLECAPLNKRCHLSNGPCQPGQYYNSSEQVNPCSRCPRDRYMDQVDHQCRTCIDCTKDSPELKHHNKVILDTCTPESNTKLGCKLGYCKVNGAHHEDGFECRISESPTDCPTTTTTTTTTTSTPDTNYSMNTNESHAVTTNVTELTIRNLTNEYRSEDDKKLVMAAVIPLAVIFIIVIFIIIIIIRIIIITRRNNPAEPRPHTVSSTETQVTSTSGREGILDDSSRADEFGNQNTSGHSTRDSLTQDTSTTEVDVGAVILNGSIISEETQVKYTRGREGRLEIDNLTEDNDSSGTEEFGNQNASGHSTRGDNLKTEADEDAVTPKSVSGKDMLGHKNQSEVISKDKDTQSVHDLDLLTDSFSNRDNVLEETRGDYSHKDDDVDDDNDNSNANDPLLNGI